MTTGRFRFGSKEAELDRTAEMVIDLASRGEIAQAIWLIYDSNRLDSASMKFLAELVQTKATDMPPETLAWAVVGIDGAVRAAFPSNLIARTSQTVGERVVRVAIRVVDDETREAG